MGRIEKVISHPSGYGLINGMIEQMQKWNSIWYHPSLCLPKKNELDFLCVTSAKTKMLHQSYCIKSTALFGSVCNTLGSLFVIVYSGNQFLKDIVSQIFGCWNSN